MHITAMEDQQPGHSPGPRIRPAAKSGNEQEIQEFQVLPGNSIAVAGWHGLTQLQQEQAVIRSSASE